MENCGVDVVDFAAIEVLLKVAKAFGRGWRVDGGLSDGWAMDTGVAIQDSDSC